MLYSGVAVAATGIAVSSGIVMKDDSPADPAATALAAAEAKQPAQQAEPTVEIVREHTVSRSDSRRDTREHRRQDPGAEDARAQRRAPVDLSERDPRDIARALLSEYGFSAAEFGCLDALWVSESDWDPHADNPASSAYGIPQALTGGTHSLPADYMTNPETQIRWGLDYIRNSYGSPCAAWEFKQANNWY